MAGAPDRDAPCPRCGEAGASEVINNPNGRFFCVCGTIHNGTAAEWARWAERRAEYRKRTHPEEVATSGSR